MNSEGSIIYFCVNIIFKLNIWIKSKLLKFKYQNPEMVPQTLYS